MGSRERETHKLSDFLATVIDCLSREVEFLFDDPQGLLLALELSAVDGQLHTVRQRERERSNGESMYMASIMMIVSTVGIIQRGRPRILCKSLYREGGPRILCKSLYREGGAQDTL